MSESKAADLGPKDKDKDKETSVDSTEGTRKRRRLAHDLVGQLRDRIKTNVRDVDAWLQLIKELESKDKSEELVDTYEQMLKYYPHSGRIWMDYIKFFLDRAEFSKVEQLYSRCLSKTPDINLWSSYIGYVLRMNANEDEKSRKVIQQAYEFALSKMQNDPQSGHIWKDYLDFLGKLPANSSWEEQHKMDEQRKAYKRAIGLPLVNIEAIWRSYNNFENNISRTTARKFIDERSGAYMSARGIMQKLNTLYKGLVRTTLPKSRSFTDAEREQLRKWHSVVALEASNFLNLDGGLLHARVMFSYRQALITMQFFPELWVDAADYCLQNNLTADAIDFLNMGLEVNSDSFLLMARLGDILESLERYDDLSAAYRKQILYLTSQQAEPQPSVRITLTYIELMKSAKRGMGLKEARKISSECRKQPYATFHIYPASAAMELQNGETVVARKIYEFAYKKYNENISFVRCYLNFLLETDDETNARVLFEKAMSAFSPAEMRPLFNEYLSYEAKRGDIGALSKLETRYLSLYPDANPIELYSRRYRVFDLDPIGNELRLQTGSPNVHEIVPVPKSLEDMVARLPPPSKYDGPSIDPQKLIDLLVANV